MRVWVLLVFCSLFFCSCSSQQVVDPKVERMNNTIVTFTKALRAPGLHSLVQSMEGKEYTPTGLLDVLFSSYGAGYWPPVGSELHPSEAAAVSGAEEPATFPVVREQPTEKWRLLVRVKDGEFLLEGYGESLQEPMRREVVDFLPARLE